MENIKAKKINEVFNKYGSTLNLHEIKSITGAGNGYKHTTIHSDNNIVNAVANNSNKFEKIYKKSLSSQLRDEKLYFAVPLLLEIYK